jgi:hypothetical protein
VGLSPEGMYTGTRSTCMSMSKRQTWRNSSIRSGERLVPLRRSWTTVVLSQNNRTRCPCRSDCQANRLR